MCLLKSSRAGLQLANANGIEQKDQPMMIEFTDLDFRRLQGGQLDNATARCTFCTYVPSTRL